MAFLPRIINVDPMAKLIDKMGKLHAEIRVKENELKVLKGKLGEHMKAAGVAQYSGELFAANWITKRVPRTDWKALARDEGIPQSIISRYTTIKTVEYPMVTARKR